MWGGARTKAETGPGPRLAAPPLPLPTVPLHPPPPPGPFPGPLRAPGGHPPPPRPPRPPPRPLTPASPQRRGSHSPLIQRPPSAAAAAVTRGQVSCQPLRHFLPWRRGLATAGRGGLAGSPSGAAGAGRAPLLAHTLPARPQRPAALPRRVLRPAWGHPLPGALRGPRPAQVRPALGSASGPARPRPQPRRSRAACWRWWTPQVSPGAPINTPAAAPLPSKVSIRCLPCPPSHPSRRSRSCWRLVVFGQPKPGRARVLPTGTLPAVFSLGPGASGVVVTLGDQKRAGGLLLFLLGSSVRGGFPPLGRQRQAWAASCS